MSEADVRDEITDEQILQQWKQGAELTIYMVRIDQLDWNGSFLKPPRPNHWEGQYVTQREFTARQVRAVCTW